MPKWKCQGQTRGGRDGYNAVEVVIVTVIVAFVILLLAMKLPRQRESARTAACQNQLRQIGVSLQMYDQSTGHLPAIPALGTELSRHSSPLKTLLEAFSAAELPTDPDPMALPDRKPGFVVTEHRVPSFLCPSDPNAIVSAFPAAVSYRATAGTTPDGTHGVFAPGQGTSLAKVQAGDGVEFTAAFSERLVGTNQPTRSNANYAEVAGPIQGNHCPPLETASWKADSGSSWIASNWQSTLYQHAITPNANPSCIASDQQSAQMGASSGHQGSVNVLLLDGGVRSFTSTVDSKIWQRLARPDDMDSTEASSPPSEK